jgi:hypothetical protein
LSANLSAAHAPDQLLGLSAEHAATNQLDPSTFRLHIWHGLAHSQEKRKLGTLCRAELSDPK